MEIKTELPPNYQDILKVFPALDQQVNNVLFAWGKIIYNPGGTNIPRHLVFHELVHGTRQIDYGIERWWGDYLSDPKFRLQEELPAHIEEYNQACLTDTGLSKDRNSRRLILKHIAGRLSSPFYGGLIKFDQAKELIKKEARMANQHERSE